MIILRLYSDKLDGPHLQISVGKILELLNLVLLIQTDHVLEKEESLGPDAQVVAEHQVHQVLQSEPPTLFIKEEFLSVFDLIEILKIY